MLFRRVPSLVVGVVLAYPMLGVAQTRTTELGEAFELERRGRYEAAAARYEMILGRNPSNLSALLGLERVLPPIGRLAVAVPYIDSALVRQPENRSIRALQLRVLADLDRRDEVGRAARAWVALTPGSVEPYREWAQALARRGDVPGARRVLDAGAGEVGEAALAQDRAELAVLVRDWLAAATHWREAVRGNSALVGPAVAAFLPVPPETRAAVVAQLAADSADLPGGRLASGLLVAWNRPGEGWVVLERVLPSNPRVAGPLLRRFADRAGLAESVEGARARGYALERLAEFSTGAAAQRVRVEAARAFTDAGDRAAAERMLRRIAADDPNPAAGAGAAASLIAVLAESGRVSEAQHQLEEWAPRLPAEARGRLRERVAWAWIARGDLASAHGALGSDSTVAALAVRGWIALFHGDLRGATGYFREAGPRAGDRSDQTRRTAALALVQPIERDTVPELGRGLHWLARGDTARSVHHLARAADELGEKGAAAVRGYAGQLALAYDDLPQAERLLTAATTATPNPLAHYHLARVFVAAGRVGDARRHLERVILDHPESAAVPLARRLLATLPGGGTTREP